MAKKRTTKQAAELAIEQIPIGLLAPYARNARTHSEQQIAQIAQSIQEFGFCNPVLIDSANGIIAGHGRVLAAQKLGMESVRCIRLGHLTDAQKRAYVIADNRIALSSGWDEDLLKIELGELHADEFDMSLLGFDVDELERLLSLESAAADQAPAADDTYTAKIVSPIYEPKGECPAIADLYDHSKTAQLLTDIRKAELPKEVAQFLMLAAERHTSFHFRNIAEFYCHASPEIQDLMERSGLIIIDFKKAIEHGFVHMTERLGQIADIEEYGDAEDAA
jgi:hypothetical protein